MTELVKKIGWVKSYRKAYDNFLYKTSEPHTKREAWEDIILHVNYEDTFWSPGSDKIECKKGQSLKSLGSWGKVFNWDKSRVQRFFEQLKKEEMIQIENMGQTIRLTVCNYDTYQGEQNTQNTDTVCDTVCDTVNALTLNNIQQSPTRRAIRKPIPIKEDKEIRIKEDPKFWKNDFEIYKKECAASFKILSQDEDLKNKIKILYPDLDFDKSLMKSFLSHWGTEEGWNGKKKSKSEKINWKSTILKTIQFNAVKL